MNSAERLTCERCGKAIAAALPGDALCCRCRYGTTQECAGEHVRDAVEEINREHARWRTASAFSAQTVCDQCGLELKTCNCRKAQ